MSRDDRLLPEVTALAGVASAVVSDVLDRMGRRDQVLDPSIRPLWPEARFVGVGCPGGDRRRLFRARAAV